MYIVPEFIPKVYLIHKDGRRWEFKNKEEAANSLWRQNYLGRYNEAPLIGVNFTVHRPTDYGFDHAGNFIYYDYIVRDETGATITVDELKDARTNHPSSKWLRDRISAEEFAKKHFRELPVPYTGSRGWGSYYRHIRTTQERCENDFLKYDEDAIEYDIKPRPVRARGLRNAWDDIGRSDYRDHNWKRHRKTQWKEKK